MQICIPIDEDHGLSSRVNAHFGSAANFLLVDTDTGACRTLINGNQHHAHGQCEPLAALGDHPIDGIVVGGIGRRALARLSAQKIQVYRASHATAGEVLEAMRLGPLQPMSPQDACAGHHHGKGGDATRGQENT
jgi:predicted Fe-Mo cluster-binding NifX family protein